MELVKQGNSYSDDKLIAGLEIPFMPTGIELASGQGILARGSILTKNTNGEYELISENTQSPEGVLTDTINTDEDTITTMYQQGNFNKDELIVGGNITDVSEIALELRKISIFTTEVK